MSVVEQLRACTAGVDRANDALLNPTPESLDRCSVILESSLKNLSSVQPALIRDRGALAEAWRLQRSVRRVAILLANAADYRRGWQHWLAIQTAGYRPDGGAAESPSCGRISLRG